MMNKPITVIMDTDGIIAATFPEDVHHKSAVEISEFLLKVGAQVIYPASAILEAAALMQRPKRYNSPKLTKATLSLFNDPSLLVESVDRVEITQAAKTFNPKMSSDHTPYDHVVLAIAKHHNADAIFSWDRFYKDNGFTLAEELV